MTGLSSLPRPRGWHGPWVQLPPDDDAADAFDITAGDQLHWAPLGDPGLCDRAASVSAWLAMAKPSAVVVDVSVETALLVRLHGVPVVSVVLPGHRADTAHLTGFRASSALVAAWPEQAGAMGRDLTPGLPDDVRSRIVCLGALSRLALHHEPHEHSETPPRRHGPSRAWRAALLQGRGGEALWHGPVEDLERRTPGWTWSVLGGDAPWVEDPSQVIDAADVVVTTAGESSLADIARLRRPAVVVPMARPYAEQHTTAAALAGGPWPAVVARDPEDAFRPEVLRRAAELDGKAWATWCDGRAADRLRRVVESVGVVQERPHPKVPA